MRSRRACSPPVAKPLAKGGARGTGGACSREASQSLASPTLLQPVTCLRREALASFAALEKIPSLGLGDVLPAPVEALPSVAGVAVDVAVPPRVDVAAPALADEALPVRRVPAQRRAAGCGVPRRHPCPLGPALDPGRLPGAVHVASAGNVSRAVRARVIGSDESGRSARAPGCARAAIGARARIPCPHPGDAAIRTVAHSHSGHTFPGPGCSRLRCPR